MLVTSAPIKPAVSTRILCIRGYNPWAGAAIESKLLIRAGVPIVTAEQVLGLLEERLKNALSAANGDIDSTFQTMANIHALAAEALNQSMGQKQAGRDQTTMSIESMVREANLPALGSTEIAYLISFLNRATGTSTTVTTLSYGTLEQYPLYINSLEALVNRAPPRPLSWRDELNTAADLAKARVFVALLTRMLRFASSIQTGASTEAEKADARRRVSAIYGTLYGAVSLIKPLIEYWYCHHLLTLPIFDYYLRSTNLGPTAKFEGGHEVARAVDLFGVEEVMDPFIAQSGTYRSAAADVMWTPIGAFTEILGLYGVANGPGIPGVQMQSTPLGYRPKGGSILLRAMTDPLALAVYPLEAAMTDPTLELATGKWVVDPSKLITALVDCRKEALAKLTAWGTPQKAFNILRTAYEADLNSIKKKFKLSEILDAPPANEADSVTPRALGLTTHESGHQPTNVRTLISVPRMAFTYGRIDHPTLSQLRRPATTLNEYTTSFITYAMAKDPSVKALDNSKDGWLRVPVIIQRHPFLATVIQDHGDVTGCFFPAHHASGDRIFPMSEHSIDQLFALIAKSRGSSEQGTTATSPSAFFAPRLALGAETISRSALLIALYSLGAVFDCTGMTDIDIREFGKRLHEGAIIKLENGTESLAATRLVPPPLTTIWGLPFSVAIKQMPIDSTGQCTTIRLTRGAGRDFAIAVWKRAPAWLPAVEEPITYDVSELGDVRFSVPRINSSLNGKVRFLDIADWFFCEGNPAAWVSAYSIPAFDSTLVKTQVVCDNRFAESMGPLGAYYDRVDAISAPAPQPKPSGTIDTNVIGFDVAPYKSSEVDGLAVPSLAAMQMSDVLWEL